MQTIVDEVGGEVNYDAVLSARSNASHWMVPIEEALRRMPNNGAFANAFQFLDAYYDYKDRAGKIDFTDMLEKAHGKGALPVRIMFVDESQDWSKRQWKIIDEWSKNCKYLYMAGDDDQSIYSFMGGDEYGFLDHDADEFKILDRSYRCPETIGQVAERIISRVSKRQEKDVSWNGEGGQIKRIPDLDVLPWHDMAFGDKSVMLLVRHRKQGGKISFGLLDKGVPHTINGYSITTSKLAENIKTFAEMKDGKPCSTVQAANMFQAAGYKNLSRDARRLAGKHQGDCTRDEFPDFPWDTGNWPNLFSKRQSDRRNIATLRRLIAQYGIDVIGKEMKIDISTYHGAKGREADIVILVTDCYPITWEEQIKNPDTEIRLCYVGITRAKETAYIVSPQTELYLKPLVEH